MKSKRKQQKPILFDPDVMDMNKPDAWYFSISELAELTNQSRETVARQLREHTMGSPGKRRGYPVYHLPTLELSNQTGIRRRLECSKCSCRRCSLLRQT